MDFQYNNNNRPTIKNDKPSALGCRAVFLFECSLVVGILISTINFSEPDPLLPFDPKCEYKLVGYLCLSLSLIFSFQLLHLMPLCQR